MDEAKIPIKPNPYCTANPISKLFFWWLNPLVLKGYRGQLEDSQRLETPSHCKSTEASNTLEKCWNDELKSKSGGKSRPKLMSAILKAFGRPFILCSLAYLLKFTVLVILQAYFLSLLTETFYLSDSDDDEVSFSRYLYALGMISTVGIGIFVFHHSFLYGQIQGLKVRVACCSLVHRKTLRLSTAFTSNTTVGQLFNVISGDVGKFDQLGYYAIAPLVQPFSLVANCIFLNYTIGVSAFAGMGMFLFLATINIFQGAFFKKLRMQKSVATDCRLKHTNAVVSDMKTIKMFSWENPYTSVIEDIRRSELKLMFKTAVLRTVNVTNYFLSDKLSMLATVLCSALLGNVVSKNIFVVSTIYSSLRYELINFLATSIEQTAGCLVAIQRLEDILLLGDMRSTFKKKPSSKAPNVRINVENFSATWNPTVPSFEVKNISMRIEESELCIISGAVGSGKTSLLLGMMGEMIATSGRARTYGMISYVAQEPWLFPASVRQNILFGKPFDPNLYQEVIHACALADDLEALDDGDMSSVGDRGMSLSGGQRARINLARAMYRNADMYLMDDPLNAVDAKVSQHIFKNCILGMAKDKTRVLVCHDFHFIAKADPYVVILDKGVVIRQGKARDVVNSDEDKTDEKTEDGNEFEEVSIESSVKRQPSKSLTRVVSCKSLRLGHPSNEDKLNSDVESSVAECEIKRKNDYKEYFDTIFSPCGAIFFVLLLFLSQAMLVVFNIWLSMWSSAELKFLTASNASEFPALTSAYTVVESRPVFQIFNHHFESRTIPIAIFGVILSLLVLFTASCSLLFFFCSVKASSTLHTNMLRGVFQAQLSFFDANPAGRIINRFSKDLEIVDDLLPMSFYTGVTRLLPVLGMMAEVTYSNNMCIVPLCIFLVGAGALSFVFFKASKPIKRMEATYRSPVYTCMSSCLRGNAVIRSHRNEDIVIKEFDQHQDAHSSVFFLYIAFMRWFSTYLELMLLCVTIMTTVVMLTTSEELSGSKFGLAISSIFSITSGLQFAVRLIAEADNLVTSIERVREYENIPAEPGYEIEELPVEAEGDWPHSGNIVYDDVSLYYGKREKQILKYVNFEICGGEKVGIVGRTGAGKSSIVAALFRMAKIGGRITVDDVDISTLPLSLFRKQLSIIPQDPVLFTGTIRYNLDPFQDYEDEELWLALEHVQLKDFLQELEGGLNSRVSEGGSNFSVGQRQLLCIARTILQKNKILVLDEATSNVDKKSDEIVQNVLRRNFQHCTLLVIAHRLDTIIDLDKVMVLDYGKVLEFDEPYKLLQDNSSAFSKLVSETGSDNFAKLKNLALQSHRRRFAGTNMDNSC